MIGLFRLFDTHRCKICGKGTKEFLVNEKDEEKWFCREHLIKNFTDIFLSSSCRMVIFHPELEKISKTIYGYFSSDESLLNKEGNVRIAELLSFIKGSCIYCQNEAKVLYFSKGFLDYSKGFLGHTPCIEKVHSTSGELLCLKHSLDKIIPDLQLNKGDFDDGLYVPNTDGVYVSAYL